MTKRVLLIGVEKSEGELLAVHLGKDDYRVECYDEPEFCPVYAGNDCTQTTPCADFLILYHHLRRKEALEHLKMYKSKCPGSMSRVALLASVMSPGELVGALELGCKVLFKPFRVEEVENWIREVSVHDDTSTLQAR